MNHRSGCVRRGFGSRLPESCSGGCVSREIQSREDGSTLKYQQSTTCRAEALAKVDHFRDYGFSSEKVSAKLWPDKLLSEGYNSP